MNAIRLFWLRGEQVNFGDDLSPLIIERLSGRRVDWASLERCQVIAIGSLMERVFFRRWKRMIRIIPGRLHVWGTGSLGDIGPNTTNLNIHAVRGPHTRSLLGLPDSLPIGDPALLLSRLMDRPTKRHRYGITPHVIHQSEPEIREIAAKSGAHVIDLSNPDVMEVASEIAACDFILSSSLHGLIVADAFGVPNVWMRLDRPLFRGEWKFHDYFASVERKVKGPVEAPFEPQALESVARHAEPHRIDRLCKGLERSFTQIPL